MNRSKKQMEKILEYRELKSKELKRLVSYSEAVALWFSENITGKPRRNLKNLLT